MSRSLKKGPFISVKLEKKVNDMNASGKKNVMGVRPMDIVFDAESPIRATIRRDTFLGNQYDYQVELMGRELRVERNALDVLADPTRYEAGQEVGLKFLNVKFYEEEAKA